MGRKSLGLTPEEMKAHREVLRKLRLYNKRLKKRQEDIALLVATVLALANKDLTGDQIIERLVRNKKWEISFTPDITSISGSSGERIKRKKN